MSDNKKTIKKKKTDFSKEEIEVLMKKFDEDTFDEVLEKQMVKQLGSAILSQHKKFNIREIVMLICGLLGGFGIASIIFGFISGIFVGV